MCHKKNLTRLRKSLEKYDHFKAPVTGRKESLQKSVITTIIQFCATMSISFSRDGCLTTKDPMLDEWRNVPEDTLFAMLWEDRKRLHLKMSAERLRIHIRAAIEVVIKHLEESKRVGLCYDVPDHMEDIDYE